MQYQANDTFGFGGISHTAHDSIDSDYTFHIGKYNLDYLFLSMWWNNVLIDVLLIPACKCDFNSTLCGLLIRGGGRHILWITYYSVKQESLFVSYKNGLSLITQIS